MEELTKSRIYMKPYFKRSPSLVIKIMLIRGRKFLLSIFLVLFFYFLILEYLEKWSVIDTMWFLIATISTVGYGDQVPHDQLGRLLVIILIIISILSIATLSTILFETVNTLSKPQFWNDYALKDVKHHVILVGGTSLSTIIADTFLEIGIVPVIVDYSLSSEITSKYLSVSGELRSAETFVKAKIESNCIGVVITTTNDTDKINAAITVRSLFNDMPIHVVLEVRKRIEIKRPLPETIYSDLNLSVIDSERLLAEEIAKYLHLNRFKKELKDFIVFPINEKHLLSEFPSDALIIPSEAVDYLESIDLNVELLGYSKIGTADFSVGYPDEDKDKEISHLMIVGPEPDIDVFRRSFCTLDRYKMPKKTLILGFGETSKILLSVLTETDTELTVLDIHQEKINEAKKFTITNFITEDFFNLYGLESKEPFDYDLTIVNMPKILAIAALARIRSLNPQTKIVVPVPDIIDAPYFYSHGASLVLVRSQLTAEAVVKNFFSSTYFFGNGLLEFIHNLPSLSISELETRLKGKVMAIYPNNEKHQPMFFPFSKKHVIDKNDNVIFFHESTNITRAKYGH